MTKDEIIKLMREACDKDKVDAWANEFWTITQDELKRFAALVAAAEREKMIAEGWRQCAKGQRVTQFCAATEQVRQEEREACARLCDARYMGDNNREDMEARRCADAIRARGEK